jgi:hypothetical protein
VGEAMEQITGLIQSAAESDNAFAAALSGFNRRVLKPLEKFLEALDKHEVSVKVRAGHREVALQREEVQTAYFRVAAAHPKTEEVKVSGRLHGTLLDSWKFDFLPTGGDVISGEIGESVTEDQAREMNTLFDKPAEATLLVTSIVTPAGESAPSYELAALQPLES